MFEKRTTEERENLTENDINERIKPLSITLQLEYLENLNKRSSMLPGIRVFVCKKLCDIYEAKCLHSLAASSLRLAAENAVIYKDKRDLYLKVGALWLKAIEFMYAADAFKKAMDAEKSSDKKALQKTIRNFYFAEADSLDKRGRMAKAVEMYEKILKTSMEGENLDEVKIKLSVLYKKLGRIKESIDLRNSVGK